MSWAGVGNKSDHRQVVLVKNPERHTCVELTWEVWAERKPD